MRRFDKPATVLLWMARSIPPGAIAGYILARFILSTGWTP
jgi:hypothetical protein